MHARRSWRLMLCGMPIYLEDWGEQVVFRVRLTSAGLVRGVLAIEWGGASTL